jgi:nucleotide-binding universal stress UspA family protein
MYSKVVVPLDGSKLAEVVLPHLEEIIKGFKIKEVMLVSVTEKVKGRLHRKDVFQEFVPEKPVYDAPTKIGTTQTAVFYWSRTGGPQDIPLNIGKMARTAADYLCKVAQGLGQTGCDTTVTVLAGDPAEEIVRFTEDFGADLILMASRGKTGFSRWDMGNIAEKVIKATRATVVLVKPDPGFKETKPKRRGISS